METSGRLDSIDLAKFIACFFVVTIHINPLEIVPVAGTILKDAVSRMFMVFFFIAAGYLFFRRLEWAEGRNAEDSIFYQYSKRILRLLGLWTVVYLPLFLLLKWKHNERLSLTAMKDWLWEIVCIGDFYHLWFLGALLVGTGLVYVVRRMGLSSISAVVAGGVLYLLGLLGNSYDFLLDGIPTFARLKDGYLELFFTTRNGVFSAPLFLALGWQIAASKRLPLAKTAALGLGGSMALLVVEVLCLNGYTEQMELFAMSPIAVTFLLCFVLQFRVPKNSVWRTLRSYSTLIYLVHPILILAVRVAASVLRISNYDYAIHYCIVALCSLAIAAVTVQLQRKRQLIWLKYFY